MVISIPPKYAAVQVVGYIKGKSAIHVARRFGERRRNFVSITSGHGVTLSRRWVATRR
jgi:REP element-mobilizing transposase RayT